MDRRGFCSAAAAIGAATGVAGAKRASGAGVEAPNAGARRTKARMKVGCQRQPMTDGRLRYLKRHGVEAICAAPPMPDRDGAWKYEETMRLKERVESHGLGLDMLFLPLDSLSIARNPYRHIMLGRSPERDREIERICEMIRLTARAEVPAVKYNLTVLGVLRNTSVKGRGDVRCRGWSLARAGNRDRLTDVGRIEADTMWERITYFLERVVPVAEEYRVRLACHPHDPGVPPGFRGIDRVLGTVDGLKRFVTIRESPYHGLNFCQGTVAEMLHDPRREIGDVIRWFGRRGKIFNVHFRNIRGRRDEFVEVFPDTGDVDMVAAMRAYRDVGYSHMVMPDHMPSHPDDPRGEQAFAFAYGYIKALIQAVSAEA